MLFIQLTDPDGNPILINARRLYRIAARPEGGAYLLTKRSSTPVQETVLQIAAKLR